MPFQFMEDTVYFVTGNAYRMDQKKFPYNQGSRDRETHHQNFQVPGRIVHFTVDGEERWATNPIWKSNGNVLTLTVTTEGHSSGNPFEGRERGFYTGKVTVFYTLKN